MHLDRAIYHTIPQVVIGILLGYAIAASCDSLESANALLPTCDIKPQPPPTTTPSLLLAPRRRLRLEACLRVEMCDPPHRAPT